MVWKNKSVAVLGISALAAASFLWWLISGNAGSSSSAAGIPAMPQQAVAGNSLDLTEAQLTSVKVEPVAEHKFSAEREAVGNIAFDDDKTVQVFPPYAGKITQIMVKAGDEVKKGSVLYGINSPDLVQAKSTLISTAGVRELTTRALERAKQLWAVQGIAQKDYQQAVSDQQTAEGAYNAARNMMRIFDFSDEEMDRVIESRKADPTFPVRTPISGTVSVIARNAAIGLVVQPGNPPAPFSVSDISTLWMVANVAESDIPMLHLGQEVEVRAMAYPDRVFRGKITNIGASVDPNTHRVAVRSEIADPRHELRSGMFATFRIHLGDAMPSPAIPLSGVTRENDGSISVWVTADRHRFTKRTVRLGIQQEGVYQVLDGLKAGEMIATDGALFLSNTLVTETR